MNADTREKLRFKLWTKVYVARIKNGADDTTARRSADAALRAAELPIANEKALK